MKKITLLLFVTIVGFTSCEKNDVEEVPFDCGCDSEETLFEAPRPWSNTASGGKEKGYLFYKTSDQKDPFFEYGENNNKFWIVKEYDDCIACRDVFFVCNEEILNTEMLALKSSKDTMQVVFTAKAKAYCRLIPVPADLFYSHGVVTSLSKD